MVSLASYMSSASSITANANPYFNRLSTGSTRAPSDNDSVENEEVYYEQNEAAGLNFDFATTVSNDLENMDNYFNIDRNATLNNNIEFNFKNQRPSDSSFSKIIKHDEEEEERSVPVIVKTPSNHKKNRSVSTLDSSSTSASLNSTIRKIPSLTANDKLPNKPSSKMAPVAPPPLVTVSPPSSSSFSSPNPFETEPDELNPFAVKDGDETTTVESKQSPKETQSSPISFLNNSETSRELLNWCRNIIDKVNINLGNRSIFKNTTLNDFSASWSNGLAFCAIIYHFKPDLM